MVGVYPIARLGTSLLLLLAVFASRSLASVAFLYAVVLVGVIICGISAAHFRFVTWVTLPFLFSLLVLYGLLIRAAPGGWASSGEHYAIYLWLRVAACGAIVQALLVPLMRRPACLKAFLEALGTGPTLGTLVLASVVILPDIRRTLERVQDARRSQGFRTDGLAGLWGLPSLLLPTISSLLVSANKRAELWSHRGILLRNRGLPQFRYKRLQSLAVILVALASCAGTFATWIFTF